MPAVKSRCAGEKKKPAVGRKGEGRKGTKERRKCLDNMTVFNQENVEEFYEIGDELGR